MDKWTEVHRPLTHSLYDDYDSVFQTLFFPGFILPLAEKGGFSLISSSCTCPWPEFVKFLYRPTFVKDYRKEIYTKFGAFRSLEVQSFHQRIFLPCDRFPAYSVIDFTETRRFLRRSCQTSTNTPLPVPTNTPLPTATGQSAPCNCTGPDLNCTDFSSHAQAQSCFSYCWDLGYGDVFGLDGDGDGVACESLP